MMMIRVLDWMDALTKCGYTVTVSRSRGPLYTHTVMVFIYAQDGLTMEHVVSSYGESWDEVLEDAHRNIERFEREQAEQVAAELADCTLEG